MKLIKDKYDAIVIGSGPGGSLTATRLAEHGLKVAMIESGGYFKFNSVEQFTQQELLTKYKNNGVTASIGSPKISYVEGSCAGGGSEVNAGLYHRTPKDVIKLWQKEYGILDLDYDDLIPFFKINEKEINVCSMPKQLIPEASMKLHRGAQELGWDSAEISRWVKYTEAGQAIKQTMTETLIPKFLLAGGFLLCNAKVNKVCRVNEEWLLDVSTLEQPLPISISTKFLFVCAGAVSTAQLLRKNKLSKLAGRTIGMHPTVKVVAKFNCRVNSKDMGVPVHQVKEFAPRVSLGCSISSLPYLHLAMQDVEDGSEIVKANWENMSIYYAMTTSGHGSISNLPFFHDPLVHYEIGEEGYENIKDGMIKLAQCLFAAGAVEIYPVVKGSRPIRSLSELRNFVGGLKKDHLNLMTIHLFSSCPMGEDMNKCVTDSYGKVWGQENLYVNDSSLICTPPGVNPQGTVMMLARRNVEKFLSEL